MIKKLVFCTKIISHVSSQQEFEVFKKASGMDAG